MDQICKHAVENAQLGSPAASVMVVGMIIAGIWGLIVYLNPPSSLPRWRNAQEAVTYKERYGDE